VTPTRVAWTVVIAGIVISILGSAFFLLRSRADNSLSGEWIARIQRPGHAAYVLRFHLQVTGNKLSGEVQGSPILEGSFENGRLKFSSSDAQFQGEIHGREIDLTVTTADGTTVRGTARKTE